MNSIPIFSNLIDKFYNNSWEKKEIEKKEKWSAWCNECNDVKIPEYNKFSGRFNINTGDNRPYIQKADIENNNMLFRNNRHGGDFLNNYYNREYTGLLPNQQNIKPFQPERIKPGLNLNSNENIDHGYNNGLISRVLPLNLHIDNFRTANNPQVSLEPDVNHSGIKYKKRGQYGQMIYPENKLYELNKKDTDRNIASEINKHPSKPNIREFNSKTPLFSSETGNGAVNSNYGTAISSIVKEPLKNKVQKHPVSNPISENTRFNNYHDSLEPTIKENNIYNMNHSNVNSNVNSRPVSQQDKLRHQTKEELLMEHTNKMIHGNTQLPVELQDKLRHQTKEELSTKPTNNMIHGFTQLPVELQDKLKETLKENFILLTQNTNLSTNTKKITTDIQDKLHTTLKELSIINTKNSNLSPIMKKNIVHYQNILKSTLKELNIVNKYISGVSNNKTVNYVIDYNDIPATTIKELFCKTYNLGIATGLINKQEYIDIVNIPPETLKEIIVENKYTGVAKINNGQYLNVQNKLKETIRALRSIFYCGIVNSYSAMPDRNAKIELNDNMDNIEYQLNGRIKLIKSSNSSMPEVNKLGKFCGKEDNNTFNQLNHSVIKNIGNYPNVNNIGKHCTDDIVYENDRFFDPTIQLKNNQFINNLLHKFR
jgi:hypothetical protein